MRLTVGEIAKALDLPSESIRYYVREGLIRPEKNMGNSYWEYSSEDVLLISDILFYRNLGISIHSIQTIFDGLPLEDIGTVIETTKEEINLKINEYTSMLSKLQLWSESFQKELQKIGEFSIGYMPAAFRVSRYYDGVEHIANYLKDSICIHKEDWQHVSISFHYNFKKDSDQVFQYISLEKNERTTARNRKYDIIEEEERLCLTTHVLYSENIHEMVNPLIEYAKNNGIELLGEIYGRERTNYYINRQRHWVCAIYAPILQEIIEKDEKK